MPAPFLPQIADHIRRIWRNGFFIDERTWQYLSTTLSDPTPLSVAGILSDADDSESGSLVELLFYPNEAMQIELEPLIGRQQFLLIEQEHLIDLLLSQPTAAALFFENFKQSITVAVPEPAVRQFVKRLNLTYQMPEAILEVIRLGLPEELGIFVKVRLRNAGFDFSGHQAELMALMLAHMEANHPDYWTCLDFGISLMAEVTPETRFYDLLMDKKRFYLNAVEKAEHFLERLQRSNMEIMMQSGQRAAFIHPEEGRKHMEMIDLICRALFGRSDDIQSPRTRTIDLGPADSEKKISRIISFLS